MTMDIENGYGSVERDTLIGLVDRLCPMLSAYVRWGYGKTTTLFTKGSANRFKIDMKRGIKQGDPIAPILFSLVLHHCLAP